MTPYKGHDHPDKQAKFKKWCRRQSTKRLQRDAERYKYRQHSPYTSEETKKIFAIFATLTQQVLDEREARDKRALENTARRRRNRSKNKGGTYNSQR